MSKVNEALKSYRANQIARYQPLIDAEGVAQTKLNREASLKNACDWVEAHLTGKYVGQGSHCSQSGEIGLYFTKYFCTEDQAKLEERSFPKWLKVKYTSLWCSGGIRLHGTEIRVGLGSNGVTGAANETGLKRLKRFLSIIQGDYVWRNEYCKGHLTHEEFRAVAY